MKHRLLGGILAAAIFALVFGQRDVQAYCAWHTLHDLLHAIEISWEGVGYWWDEAQRLCDPGDLVPLGFAIQDYWNQYEETPGGTMDVIHGYVLTYTGG